MSLEICRKKRGISPALRDFCTPNSGVPYINLPSGAACALSLAVFLEHCFREVTSWT